MKDKFVGYIYCITNGVNSKKYIGQTSTSIHKRYVEHLRCARTGAYENCLLYRAIHKYGEDNFFVEEVERVVSDSKSHLKDLLNKRECYHIKTLGTMKPNGYNMTSGGDAFASHTTRSVCMVDSDGIVLKIYDSMADAERELSLPFGSIRRSFVYGSHYANGYFWYDVSDINVPVGGSIGKQYRTYITTVYQFNLDGSFVASYPSIAEASRQTGIHHSTISSACSGKKYSSGGFLWSYTEDPPVYIPRQFTSKCKPVQQISMDGEVVNVYPSAAFAARELKLQPALIAACCRGTRKSTGGYRWAFVIKNKEEKSNGIHCDSDR